MGSTGGSDQEGQPHGSECEPAQKYTTKDANDERTLHEQWQSELQEDDLDASINDVGFEPLELSWAIVACPDA